MTLYMRHLILTLMHSNAFCMGCPEDTTLLRYAHSRDSNAGTWIRARPHHYRLAMTSHIVIDFLLFWMFSGFIYSRADHVVYLDRPGHANSVGHVIWEPYFNPKSLEANVGERIRFVARLANIESINVQWLLSLTLIHRIFSHLNGRLGNPTMRHLVSIMEVLSFQT